MRNYQKSITTSDYTNTANKSFQDDICYIVGDCFFHFHGVLVPSQGSASVPPAMEAQSLNQSTTIKVPK